MDRNEIIHIFENSRLVSDSFTSEAVTAAYVEAIAALREQEERENPKPLTLDELRQMDGEPVWIVWPDGRINSKWWIVGNYDWHMMEFDENHHNYGKTWLAYRSKPKDG